VARTGEHAAFPGWDAGRWSRGYWTDKLAVEDEVRASGLRWTILRPAFLMENCIPPKSTWMFPHLHEGRLVTALLPQTRLQFIAAADVAAFACAALEQPQRFDRQAIALAAEDLTMDEVAGVLARAWSRPVEAVSLAPDAAVAAGCMAPVVRSQAWSNEVSYGVDIAALRGWGLPLTSFADWARRHAPAGPA
jgi:uncharacterized protein YbjT (DUF2867 family)